MSKMAIVRIESKGPGAAGMRIVAEQQDHNGKVIEGTEPVVLPVVSLRMFVEDGNAYIRCEMNILVKQLDLSGLEGQIFFGRRHWYHSLRWWAIARMSELRIKYRGWRRHRELRRRLKRRNTGI